MSKAIELKKLNDELADNIKQGDVINKQLNEQITNEQKLLNDSFKQNNVDTTALLTVMIIKGKLASRYLDLYRIKQLITIKISSLNKLNLI